MLNGIAGAGAVCCADVGTIDTKPITIGGVKVNVPRSGKGLLQQIGEALNNAIHGGDAGSAGRGVGADRAARSYSGGANVIPFPMVNPFKPVVNTGAPVTALTAFPDRFTYEVEGSVNGSEPDDEQSSLDGFSGLAGLGYSWADFGQALPSPLETWGGSGITSGPTKLQTILGTIQATLPATIQAIRAQPSNIFPGTSYNPYTTNYPGATYPGGDPRSAGADIGASAGAAVGNVGDTIGGIVARHPYLVLGGVAAVLLLFMNPPRRR